MAPIAGLVSRIVKEGFKPTFGKPSYPVTPDPIWQNVCETGTQLWLDTGDVEVAKSLWNSCFSALTTNNTLLNREVQKGIYDELIRRTVTELGKTVPGIDEKTLVLETAFVLNAYHALRLVETFDVFVSVELHTDLAEDIERTVSYGKRYFAICPERFIVKVPLTPQGYLGARKLVQAGVPINFTLGFSARHNVAAACIANPDYVNVFMGRLNSFVADSHLGSGDNVGEKATLATQRALLGLRKQGRSKSLLIGASMREGSQIRDLAGLDVFTMPPAAAAQYHAAPADAIRSRIQRDPAVTFAEGVDGADFYASSLWDVPAAFTQCLEALTDEKLDAMDGPALQAYFAASGFLDLLPLWSQDDRNKIMRDGKIPVFETWKAALASKTIGLDALMNLSALQSFTKDQQALDDRIRGML
ncbi:MAG: transaldolase [Verrucomicrobia bacterium]|nr:transaldolase [Verrucomicrobiota bacterium]